MATTTANNNVDDYDGEEPLRLLFTNDEALFFLLVLYLNPIVIHPFVVFLKEKKTSSTEI